MMTIETAERMLRSGEAIVNIGQVGRDLERALERAVRQGRLVKYRGHWNTLSPIYGMGPLKTIYVLAPTA